VTKVQAVVDDVIVIVRRHDEIAARVILAELIAARVILAELIAALLIADLSSWPQTAHDLSMLDRCRHSQCVRAPDRDAGAYPDQPIEASCTTIVESTSSTPSSSCARCACRAISAG